MKAESVQNTRIMPKSDQPPSKTTREASIPGIFQQTARRNSARQTITSR